MRERSGTTCRACACLSVRVWDPLSLAIGLARAMVFSKANCNDIIMCTATHHLVNHKAGFRMTEETKNRITKERLGSVSS
jgi:hypothetical protein